MLSGFLTFFLEYMITIEKVIFSCYDNNQNHLIMDITTSTYNNRKRKNRMVAYWLACSSRVR